MPRLKMTGFAPADTFLMPSWMIACASMSAVVVPSPATALVLVATSLTSCAAWFSKMFPRSISCAMLTPSLVMVGEIRGLCSTTYWPFGPSVVLTALASLFTPASMDRRASVSNLSFLCATLSLPSVAQHFSTLRLTPPLVSTAPAAPCQHFSFSTGWRTLAA